jgi:hypothetical protein
MGFVEGETYVGITGQLLYDGKTSRNMAGPMDDVDEAN